MRDEINRDAVELWLVTRGMKQSTRPPRHRDEASSRSWPASRPEQDLVWIEAISSPDAQATNVFLERTLKELERDRQQPYRLIRLVYTGEQSDPSLPESWRARTDNFAPIYLGLLDAAFDYFLLRAHAQRILLYWPDPDDAKGYADEQARKKREARFFFVKARERGDSVTRAVKKAATNARCSERAVWKWLNGWA